MLALERFAVDDFNADFLAVIGVFTALLATTLEALPKVSYDFRGNMAVCDDDKLRSFSIHWLLQVQYILPHLQHTAAAL